VFFLIVNAAIKSHGLGQFCSDFAESNAFLDPEIWTCAAEGTKSVAFDGTIMASFRG
jgi:hypothetical protein